MFQFVFLYLLIQKFVILIVASHRLCLFFAPKNKLWTQIIRRYASLLSVFTDILLWLNVAGYHGYALTAAWVLCNITIEIILAYNPLHLDSIFTVTKLSTNVFQL